MNKVLMFCSVLLLNLSCVSHGKTAKDAKTLTLDELAESVLKCNFCSGYDGPGGVCYKGPGGVISTSPGGYCYSGPGGPLYSGPGAALSTSPGGLCSSAPGGNCYQGPGADGKKCPLACRLNRVESSKQN